MMQSETKRAFEWVREYTPFAFFVLDSSVAGKEV
jgi:hypothetical protein